MKQDKIKTNEGARSINKTDTVNHNKINPFKEHEANQDKTEAIEQDEAISEQQRKEALTERD